MTEREGATVRTSDGVEITHDLRVWTNDFRPGPVGIDDRRRPHQEAGEWWCCVLEDRARHPALSSESRVTTRHPDRRAVHATPQLHEWDLITAAERRALDATPFSDGTQGCSMCHTPPPTAGDVARHYLVPDLRDKNLGECPTKWDD
jgi:hypothetical protein